MLRRFSIELTRWTSKGGMCAKRLAHRAGVSVGTIYAARKGRLTVHTFGLILPHMPSDSQARIGAECGLLVQPLVDNGATLGEAAARCSDFTSDFVHALADGTVDRQERRRLRDRAAGLVAKLSGWLRRERANA